MREIHRHFKEMKYMFLIGLGLVRAVKNCDESLENVVLSEVTVSHQTDPKQVNRVLLLESRKASGYI